MNSGVSSSSTTTGALVISGGVGVSGNVNVGGNIFTNSITSISNNLTINANVNVNGMITVPTMISTDNSTSIATTAFVTTAINNISSGDCGAGGCGGGGGGGNMFNKFYYLNFSQRNIFTDINFNSNSNVCNSIAVSNNNYLYIAVNNFSNNTTFFYKSIDYGFTWSNLIINASNNSYSRLFEKCLITCSQYGKYVFITMNNIIKYSTNYGSTFNDYYLTSGNVPSSQNHSTPCCSSSGKYVFTVYRTNTTSNVFYAKDFSYNIFYLSRLNNASWPTILLNQTCSYNGKIVFTIGGTSISTINTIYKSIDFGETFDIITPQPSISNFSHIQSNSEGCIVYISSGGTIAYGGSNTSGAIYKSIDGGNTFTTILTDNRGFTRVNCNGYGNMVVACTYNGPIQISYNYGVHWNSVNYNNSPWVTTGLSPLGDLLIAGDYNTNSQFNIVTFNATCLNTGNIFISDTTNSNSNTSGALVVSGGVGVSGNVNIKGNMNATNIFTTRVGVSGDVNVHGNLTVNQNANIGNLILNKNSFYINTNLITVPNSAITIVGRNTADTLTNKTLTDCSANTPLSTDNSVKIATTAFVTTAFTNFLNSPNTLTDKTLTTPVISLIKPSSLSSNTLTLPDITDTLVGRNTADTLTNKTLTTPVISLIKPTASNTLTLPDITDTLVGKITVDTLTNKTLNGCSANTPLPTDDSVKIATTAFVKASLVDVRNQWVWTDSNGNLTYSIVGGKVGIGTTSPAYKLDLSGDLRMPNASTIYGNNASGTAETFLHPRWADNITYLNYGSGGFNIRNNSSVSTMFMKNGGDVGIGTTTPGYRLDVDGTIRSKGFFSELTSYANITLTYLTKPAVQFRNDGSNFYFLLTNDNDQYGGWNNLRPFRFNTTSGRVTIPDLYVETVLETVKINITGTNVIEFGSNQSKEVNAGKIGYGTFDSTALCIVGAGSSNTLRIVKIYDSLTVTETTTSKTFNATSDYRLKSNIQPISQTIDHLKPIEYDLSGGGHCIGFLAHEVQEHFPFLVSGKKDGEEMQSINYIGLIGLLVKEIQDLKSSVKTLQNKIEILESK